MVGTAPVPPWKGTRSFAQVLAGSKTLTKDIVQQLPDVEISSVPKLFKGEPAFFLSQDEQDLLAAPFRLSLVGKFTKGRPKMDFLRGAFEKIGFKGNFTLGMIDFRHVLITFESEEDYQRCWLRSIWTFASHIMRIFKWSPDFHPDHESPIVPVWVSFEGLPIHCFHKKYLRKLTSYFGTPLKVDTPTTNLSRPSTARVCVEINLLHDLPHRIRLETEEHPFFQAITYEDLSQYCKHCQKVGHTVDTCRQLLPKESALGKDSAPGKPPKTLRTWKPKESIPSSSGLSIEDKQDTVINVSTDALLLPLISPTVAHHEQKDEPLHPQRDASIAQIESSEQPIESAVPDKIDSPSAALQISSRFTILANLEDDVDLNPEARTPVPHLLSIPDEATTNEPVDVAIPCETPLRKDDNGYISISEDPVGVETAETPGASESEHELCDDSTVGTESGQQLVEVSRAVQSDGSPVKSKRGRPIGSKNKVTFSVESLRRTKRPPPGPPSSYFYDA